MDLTAQTATASTVQHPFGGPSGPGLFRVKGLQLPAYIQNVAHALQRSGSAKDESTAIQMAVGIIQRWAAGDAGHGKRVHPDVQAAAVKALAEWEAAKARAHAQSNEGGDAVDLSSDLGDAMTRSWNATRHPATVDLALVAPGGGGTTAAPASTKGLPTAAQVNIATGATGPRAKSSSKGSGKQSGSGGGSSGSLHPHVPAGSSAGGQFAKKGSGTSSSSGSGTAAKKPAAAGAPAKKAATGKTAPPKANATPKAPAKAKTPAGAKPKPPAGSRAAKLAQKTQLQSQAKNDRTKARAIFKQIAQLTATIHAQVKASAASKASTTATKTAAAAATTAAATTAAAAKTAATAATTTAKTTAATAAKTTSSVPAMRAKRAGLRVQAHTLVTRANTLDKQAAAIKLSGDASAVELVGPHGYVHGWIKVGVGEHDAPEEKADKMSANAFRRGDGSQDALQGHREAAKAHRAAASLSSSPARSAYHSKMANLHSRVASTRMTSNKAADQAHGLKQGVRGLANSGEDGSAGRFLELAFTEALTERVPPGRSEGGQFHARTSLTRHDTPEQAARAVNAMDETQRARVRATTLPPPGFTWGRGDRLVTNTVSDLVK